MSDVPLESRPTEPPSDVTLLPRGQGQRRLPRLADDDTVWCIGCDHTLIPGTVESMCRECARKRKNYLERTRRASTAHVPVSIENAQRILESNAAVQQAAFELLAAQRGGYLSNAVIHQLTLACKALTGDMILGLKKPLRDALEHNERVEAAPADRL